MSLEEHVKTVLAGYNPEEILPQMRTPTVVHSLAEKISHNVLEHIRAAEDLNHFCSLRNDVTPNGVWDLEDYRRKHILPQVRLHIEAFLTARHSSIPDAVPGCENLQKPPVTTRGHLQPNVCNVSPESLDLSSDYSDGMRPAYLRQRSASRSPMIIGISAGVITLLMGLGIMQNKEIRTFPISYKMTGKPDQTPSTKAKP